MKTWKATPHRKRAGWLVVIGPYDPDFVEDLKACIPPADREWSPVGKRWLVRESWDLILDGVITRHTETEPPPPREEITPATLIEIARGLGEDLTMAMGEDLDEALQIAIGGAKPIEGDELVAAAVNVGERRCVLVVALVEIGARQ